MKLNDIQSCFLPIDTNGKITGNHVAYIYTGSKLVLFGKFKNNEMISAQKANIQKISCKNHLLSIEFGKVSGPSFHRSISTNSSFGEMPLVQVTFS